MELLWPDQSPVRGGNRLSVLLTTLRRVLDPQRLIDFPGPVVADRSAVRLDLKHVDVDVERFLAAAAAAQQAEQSGRGDATALLRAAANLYRGDFLADDPYDDWAEPLRDEAVAAYIGVLRTLAARIADTDEKALHLMRLVHHDPYDEEAHLGLVKVLRDAGRHGEAHRRYRSYAQRMAELGVDPVPLNRARHCVEAVAGVTSRAG
jgi:DNA-binding SARP family transcriptional activator